MLGLTGIFCFNGFCLIRIHIPVILYGSGSSPTFDTDPGPGKGSAALDDLIVCAEKRRGITISETVSEVDQEGGVHSAHMQDRPKAGGRTRNKYNPTSAITAVMWIWIRTELRYGRSPGTGSSSIKMPRIFFFFFKLIL